MNWDKIKKDILGVIDKYHGHIKSFASAALQN